MNKIVRQTRRVVREGNVTTTTTETTTTADETRREPSGPRYVGTWLAVAVVAGAWLAFIVATGH